MPMLVSFDNIISGVSDVFNTVMVYGDGIDQAMFYGRGAGKLPTASAVLGDMINSVQHDNTVDSQYWESSSDDSFIASADELKGRWYFRLPAGTEFAGEGSYSSENGVSYVTEEELTFAEAKAKAVEMGALAFLPVLE